VKKAYKGYGYTRNMVGNSLAFLGDFFAKRSDELRSIICLDL